MPSTHPAAAPAPSRRVPAFVKASVACHVAAGAAVVAAPAAWPWALAAVAINHAVLTGAGLWPRSDWLGPNLTRLPAAARARREVALTIDDGPDPAVTPAVLDLLDAAGAKATFFCIAERAAAHPQLVGEIARRGHSVQNHSQRHRVTFSLLGSAGLRREVAAAQRTLAGLTGEVPRFFRAPAGLRNPLLGQVLDDLGLILVSWTRRGFDTVRAEPERVLDRLRGGLDAGDILLLHDGNAARTEAGRPVIVEVLPRLLAEFERAGLEAVTLPAAQRGDDAR